MILILMMKNFFAVKITDQNCYMSLLVLDETISDSFGHFLVISITYILRYSLIYVVGFFPLVYLIKNLQKIFLSRQNF